MAAAKGTCPTNQLGAKFEIEDQNELVVVERTANLGVVKSCNIERYLLLLLKFHGYKFKIHC